ncbi:MAG: hypothetical protein GY928_08220 [Colwellia sp.]|nr:hypothetical protein [Colwellia sp.]
MQILKLGLSGSESTLPTESRINEQGQDTFQYVEGQSADGSLKVDIIGTKKNFTVSWGVMSDTDFNALYAIYLLQITNDTFLSYIYTDVSGSTTTKQVFMQPPTQGSLIQRDVYYSNAVTIQMQETS